MTHRDPRLLRRLRTLGLVEGTSTLVLFGVAMPMKYILGMLMAVSIVGALHSALFVMLCALAFWAAPRVPLPRGLALRICVAAVVPFGPFLLDGRLRELES